MGQARQRFVASFSVLRIRDMRRVWGSQVLSEVGDWAARFALAVLVYDRTGSPFLTAATLAVTYLPYLLSPIITPIAQRYSLRRMMIGSDVIRVVLYALTFLAVATFGVTIAADVPMMTGSMMMVPDQLRAPFVSIVQPGLMGIQAFGALAAGAMASLLPTTSTMAIALIVPVAYSSWALIRTLPPAVIDLRSSEESDASDATSDEASDASLP